MDVTDKSKNWVAAALALAALAFVPAPAGAGHNPDLIPPSASGAEFQVLRMRLFEAAQKGETENVIRFLAEGAPVEGRDRFGNTALLGECRRHEADAKNRQDLDCRNSNAKHLSPLRPSHGRLFS